MQTAVPKAQEARISRASFCHGCCRAAWEVGLPQTRQWGRFQGTFPAESVEGIESSHGARAAIARQASDHGEPVRWPTQKAHVKQAAVSRVPRRRYRGASRGSWDLCAAIFLRQEGDIVQLNPGIVPRPPHPGYPQKRSTKLLNGCGLLQSVGGVFHSRVQPLAAASADDSAL